MDWNGNNDKSKSFPFINEIPSLQRFSRDDFKCSLPISSNLKKVFNDMEKEEDEWSESSSFQEFQFFMVSININTITYYDIKFDWIV